ncbi:hypothetical protein BC1002_5563 [Paraburkholderia atlantica]|uniref:Uncharacterized protein n=1 Tax=Paraburkholderia atlantica TaxID=2654982 RepID=D5WGN7_PARAM|nr:hypothetical protein [Paraburkholderia atlantica]ADG19488.1 hypothetical protein BC1002_5563 [Paraburkholderia atlantica]
MEQLKQQSSGTDWTVEEECDLCRITYSIYSNFPPMPHAQALNAETGEFFPFDRVRKMKSGYAMAEALGYAWACNCRRRKAAPALTSSDWTHDEQYTLKDGDGRIMRDTYYTVRLPSGSLVHGVTDGLGRTKRYKTNGAQSIYVYLGHREEA